MSSNKKGFEGFFEKSFKSKYFCRCCRNEVHPLEELPMPFCSKCFPIIQEFVRERMIDKRMLDCLEIEED